MPDTWSECRRCGARIPRDLSRGHAPVVNTSRPAARIPAPAPVGALPAPRAKARRSRRRVPVLLAVLVALVLGGLSGQVLDAAPEPPPVPVGYAEGPGADGGFWVTWPDGRVEAHGEAHLGDAAGIPLRFPIVGMAPTSTRGGYWLVASDGGVFSFGDATFDGSTGAITLNKPIVGMAATPSGQGYWLVASDGGVFSFGDAQFFGSTAASSVVPARSITAAATGGGYWLLDVTGTVHGFGDVTRAPSTLVGVAPGADTWTSVWSGGGEAPPPAPDTTVPAVEGPEPAPVPEAPAPASGEADSGEAMLAAAAAAPIESATIGQWKTFSPPSSVDRTGARDVTGELQTFLSSVPHHARISFPSGARYRIEGTLRIANRNDIVVDGNGATFFATQATTDRNRSQWVIENVSNIVLEDMTIRGAHPNGGVDESAYVSALEAQHGISISGGDRIEVRNIQISDVYGDFVYIGRSRGPAYGRPTNVHIHDNVFQRNGRQGISVVEATDVLVERNYIGDTRRATIAFEPLSEDSVVRRIWVRSNQIGPGRLMFVAGAGKGDISDIYIQNNKLNRTLGMDFNSSASRRSNVVVTGNVSTRTAGSGRGAVIRFVRYDGVVVTDNVQPGGYKRDMHMVGDYNSCFITARNNDLGQYGAGQVKVLEDSYTCPSQRPAVAPAPQLVPVRTSVAVDAGGVGAPAFGIARCTRVSDCGGLIRGGTTKVLVAGPLRGLSSAGLMYRTMLHGDPKFAIPIRPGTYEVELTFVEPTFDSRRDRYFHFDIERERKESSLDVWQAAGRQKNTLVTRKYTVTIGDGALNIDFDYAHSGAIVSFIKVTRL